MLVSQQEVVFVQEGSSANRTYSEAWGALYLLTFCLCSQVLVMEYVPGIKINRLDAIDKLGVNRER